MVIDAIEAFVCQNYDVEKFIKKQAINFEKRHLTRTYILVDEGLLLSERKISILAYFTLTLKTIKFVEDIPKTIVKRIDGFYKSATQTNVILIAQLGKNYNYKSDVEGKYLLELAMDIVYKIHNLIGTRIAFIECENSEKLINFYTNNKFVYLQNRDEYIQMFRYL